MFGHDSKKKHFGNKMDEIKDSAVPNKENAHLLKYI